MINHLSSWGHEPEGFHGRPPLVSSWERSSKDPTAFSNNQQSPLWMGFFACLPVGRFHSEWLLKKHATQRHPEGLQPRRIPCQPISNYHCCAWDSSLTFRMTIIFLCHPESAARRIPCQPISNYHYCGWDSSLRSEWQLKKMRHLLSSQRRLPAVGGPACPAYRQAGGRQEVWDPMAFRCT